jgi:hypothetical protein
VGYGYAALGHPRRRRPSSVTSRRTSAPGRAPIRSRGDPRRARPDGRRPAWLEKSLATQDPESMILPSIRGWTPCAATRASSRCSADGLPRPRLPASGP